MINIKEETKFSLKAKYYVLTYLLLAVFLLAIVFSAMGNNNFFGTFFVLVIVFCLPIYIYISILYNCLSFIVDENNITINSGIIVKKSTVIPFDKIQSINSRHGILMGMFAITNLDIWTSSQAQISINNGNSATKPDGNLILSIEDAEWLKSFMTYKEKSA